MDELGFTLAGFAVLGGVALCGCYRFCRIRIPKVEAYGVDHSPCSRYVRRFFVYFSGSGTYRPPQNAGLRRRPAYHPAETRAGVVRAAFNECRY